MEENKDKNNNRSEPDSTMSLILIMVGIGWLGAGIASACTGSFFAWFIATICIGGFVVLAALISKGPDGPSTRV